MSVDVRNDQGVLVIGLNRPEKKNALTAAMYQSIADALRAGGEDAAVRCFLLHGTDDAFTAGNDLDDFLRNPPQGEASPVSQFLRGISACAKPIVAAVSGPAVGVGTTMLLHCDLVYASQTARFSTPFTQLALCPEAASSLLMPMVAGYRRAAEKLLLGEPFDAAEAHACGIVNRVLPPASLRETKRLMKGALADAIPTRMDEEGAVFGRMLVAPEAREAFTAFFEKRRPDFSRFA
jgi:enoyl-CoA hydratase/carnithine racemase